MLLVSPMPVSSAPQGARPISEEVRTLPLVATNLCVDTRGGLARLTWTQRFRNVHAVPLAVTYTLPLPADAAVSGFVITVGARRIVGEIDRRSAARERFEDALLEGKTAGLLEQDRSSLFTQELGNVPPGADVSVEVVLDQRLAWLEDGWELRFPTTVAPRYLGETGRVVDAARLAVELATGPAPARLALSLRIRDGLTAGSAPSSPSHALHLAPADGHTDVTLAGDAPLDRDLVVRWSVAQGAPGLVLDATRFAGQNEAFGLLTVVPPRSAAKAAAAPRDLVVLLDTSGSMAGAPLEQARRVALALVDTLGDRDGLELLEFSNVPRRFRPTSQPATAATKAAARVWLGALQASGGTEMRDGILEALRPLRPESQRQVVLVTDGLIGFEREIVGAILATLPLGSRVHTVGVGSSVNRSLTSAAARAGRGLEAIVAPGEDVEPLVRRLIARTCEPLVVGLSIGGSAVLEVAPSRLPDLFAGSPALAALSLSPHGGELVVSGRTDGGSFEARLFVPPIPEGPMDAAPAKLFAREKVEDLEMAVASGASNDAAIEALGLRFGISTRLTSWVAVTEEPTVDPSKPTRRERMPHVLAQGLAAGMGPLGMVGGPLPMMAMSFGRASADQGMLGFGSPPAPMGMPSAPPRAPSATPYPQAPAARGGARRAEASSEGASRAEKPRGLLERLKRAFFDDADEESTVVRGPEAPLFLEHSAQATAGPARTARVVQASAARIVLELVLADDVGDLGAEPLVVVFADGTYVEARLAAGSTRGAARAGDTVRLVLVPREGAVHFPESPERVELADGSTLTLSP